jgi:hypothetical protein
MDGNTLTMDTSAREFVRGVGPLTFHLVAKFQRREDSFCGNLGDADVSVSGGVLPSDIREQAIRSGKRRLARDGTVCMAYLRGTDGRIYSVTLDRNGRIKGSADPVQFFAKPKPLSL